MIKELDKRLEGVFLTLGDRFNRSGLFKRAAVFAGTVVGAGALSQQAIAAPCGDQWGACEGLLCCNCYDGCKCRGSAYYCGDRPAGCYVQTAKWSRCCQGTYRYDWYDCGFLVTGSNACCNAGGSPGLQTGCSSCIQTCGFPYVPCYRCTFRVLVGGGC